MICGMDIMVLCVLLKPLFDNLFGRKYCYGGEESLNIKGGDNLPWFPAFYPVVVGQNVGCF